MRLETTAHTTRPWRIHEIAPDFVVEDVWALPTPGGPDDFPRLLELITGDDPELLDDRGRYVGDGSGGVLTQVARALFELRWKLGDLFGWDGDDAGVGQRVATLRDRLPPDLRDGPPCTPPSAGVPMSPVFQTSDEWAAELANKTVHSVMHLGWVPDGADGYRGQMAVLVKPNGRLGALYMAAIKPFRYLVVYPALLRSMARRWRR